MSVAPITENIQPSGGLLTHRSLGSPRGSDSVGLQWPRDSAFLTNSYIMLMPGQRTTDLCKGLSLAHSEYTMHSRHY